MQVDAKHIHSVELSYLKQIYQATYSLQESSVAGQIICQRCSSTNYKKFGIRHNKNSVQRYSKISMQEL
jgi:hypothetical protein